MSERAARGPRRCASPCRAACSSTSSTARSRGGEFIALLGGNGTGKSLLLRTLAGLRPPPGARCGSTAGTRRHCRGASSPAARLPAAGPGRAAAGIACSRSVLLGRFAHLGFWERSGADDERRATQRARRRRPGRTRRARAGHALGRRAAPCRHRAPAGAGAGYLPAGRTHQPPRPGAAARRPRAPARADARPAPRCSPACTIPNLALRFADRVWLLSGDGPVQMLTHEALEPRHLARLYGVEYAEDAHRRPALHGAGAMLLAIADDRDAQRSAAGTISPS